MAQVKLPRFIALKSKDNGKYLQFTKTEVELLFSGDYVASPYTKFEVEPSRIGGLVHLRCCFNNKYCIGMSCGSPRRIRIVAAAELPEENQSKEFCTLFKPVYDDKGGIRFSHVQQGFSLTGSEIVDWDSLLILPRYVAFKNLDGKYLIPCDCESDDPHKHRRLHFAGSDKGEAGAGNEVFLTPDGNFIVKNTSLDRFWKQGSDGTMWVCPGTGAIHYDRDPPPSVSFSAVKVENNVIAIRSLDNNKFCKPESLGDWFTANAPTICTETNIVVEEFVISRNIYDINYRISDARIHSQEPLNLTSRIAINETQEPNSVELMLKYMDSRSSTWKSTVSLHLGMKTGIKIGVPFISGGSLKIQTDINVAKEWGDTVSYSKQEETLYKVVVPPMSKVTVSVLATQGSCDIPFSYKQRDVLYDGRTVTSYMDDGIYLGVNHYNVRFETKQAILL